MARTVSGEIVDWWRLDRHYGALRRQIDTAVDSLVIGLHVDHWGVLALAAGQVVVVHPEARHWPAIAEIEAIADELRSAAVIHRALDEKRSNALWLRATDALSRLRLQVAEVAVDHGRIAELEAGL